MSDPSIASVGPVAGQSYAEQASVEDPEALMCVDPRSEGAEGTSGAGASGAGGASGQGPSSSEGGSSCGDEALCTVGACGLAALALLGSGGLVAVLGGASCLGNAGSLIECLDNERAESR